MDNNRDPKVAQEFEQAIKFLVHKIEDSNGNSKPVILHSIRVGIYLDREGYSRDIVVAGFLHDLLEDSDTTEEEISQRFGESVAKLVKAASFDKNVSDKRQRYAQTYHRGIQAGKDALVVKAADILDNSCYYSFTDSQESYDWLVFGKLKHFVENTEEVIGKEKVWQELRNRLEKLSKETLRTNIS